MVAPRDPMNTLDCLTSKVETTNANTQNSLFVKSFVSRRPLNNLDSSREQYFRNISLHCAEMQGAFFTSTILMFLLIIYILLYSMAGYIVYRILMVEIFVSMAGYI